MPLPGMGVGVPSDESNHAMPLWGGVPGSPLMNQIMPLPGVGWVLSGVGWVPSGVGWVPSGESSHAMPLWGGVPKAPLGNQIMQCPSLGWGGVWGPLWGIITCHAPLGVGPPQSPLGINPLPLGWVHQLHLQ
jgi:hypothetical protein